MKKNEILPFVTTWMGLEGIMLSEIRQRQILYEITYIWNIENRMNKQTYQDRNRWCRYREQMAISRRKRGRVRDEIGEGY